MTAKVKRYILLNGSKVPVARMAQSDNGIGDWVSAADYDKLVGEYGERIRLLEQKNQALEEVIAGYRKPEIL